MTFGYKYCRWLLEDGCCFTSHILKSWLAARSPAGKAAWRRMDANIQSTADAESRTAPSRFARRVEKVNALWRVPRSGARETCLTFQQIPAARIEGHFPLSTSIISISISKFSKEASLSISMKAITCTRPHSFGAAAEYVITWLLLHSLLSNSI